jgi:hypothetical protein
MVCCTKIVLVVKQIKSVRKVYIRLPHLLFHVHFCVPSSGGEVMVEGQARSGEVRRGRARLDEVCQGWASFGEAGGGWRGQMRSAEVGRGWISCVRHLLERSSKVNRGQARSGEVGQGWARLGEVWRGLARSGEVGLGREKVRTRSGEVISPCTQKCTIVRSSSLIN